MIRLKIREKKFFFSTCLATLLFIFFQNCSGSFQTEKNIVGLDRNISSSSSSSSSETLLLLTNNYKEAAQSLLAFPKYNERVVNFGYYGITGWGQDYFSEVKNHSNTIWIAPEIGDPITAVETIRSLEKIYLDSGTMAVIDVERIFFDNQLRLRPDAVQRWSSYVKNLKPYFHKILSIYPMDEPYGWGMGVGLKYEDMQKQMESVADIIKKSSFRNIPLSISFTTRTTHLPIPKGYDWVGIDCYGDWDNCDGKSIVQHNQILKDKMLSNQKIILFADAGLRSVNMKFSDVEERKLLDRLAKYFEYAQSDTQVVGVFAFIWQSIPSQNTIGTKDIPLVKKEIVNFANRYLKRNLVALQDCAGGQADVPSNDRKNSCHFKWDRTKVGISLSSAEKTISSTGGGTATATCRSDGAYDFTWSCPNANNSPRVCSAGYVKKSSLDKSNVCEFSWALANEGENIVITNSTNGGVLVGKCLSDTSWNFSYNCPGKVPSCDGGSIDVPSTSDPTNQSKSCRFTWDPTPADELAINLKDIYGRGSAFNFKCSSDGKSWKQGIHTCP